MVRRRRVLENRGCLIANFVGRRRRSFRIRFLSKNIGCYDKRFPSTSSSYCSLMVRTVGTMLVTLSWGLVTWIWPCMTKPTLIWHRKLSAHHCPSTGRYNPCGDFDMKMGIVSKILIDFLLGRKYF